MRSFSESQPTQFLEQMNVPPGKENIMNPIAQQALDLARKPTPASKLLPPILANPPLPALVITGPINRVMELESKRYAVDVVQSAGADIRRSQVVEKIIRNLTTYATQQPPSVASGVKIVIDLLKGAG